MKVLKTIATLAATIAVTPLFAATAFQNQVGFMTSAQKQMALVGAEGKEVQFKDEGGKTALAVTAPKAVQWAPAGDTAASLVDFSELKTAGIYQAYVGEEKVGHPIIVKDNALEEAGKAALKFFYYQRSSTALPEEFAGQWARAAGHPDTAVMYHASTGHVEGAETFNGAKGWYDAGDYGKYIVNSGISTYTLLQLYQQNKAYYDTLNLNIPESKNNVPDLLDEIRWNLEWMLTMQDADGGIFHKLTTKKFAGTVMPEAAKAQRYAIGKGLEAGWNFTAVMSLASEIYAPYDKEFAEKCIIAAQKARNWSYQNPYSRYEQPSDVNTGAYTGAAPFGIRFWANVEMYRVSRNQELLDTLNAINFQIGNARLQSWSNSFMLGLFTIATNPNIFPKAMADTAKSFILTVADSYLDSIDNGYGLAIVNKDFIWGSNGTVSNKAMILVHAYILSKDIKYLNAAQGIVDYILGRNPLDLSYLTGYGVNPIMNPHHRISQADKIEAPVPGMIAGGPNSAASDCAKSHIVPGAAAKSYYDNSCSYATNEVAINWNAPFAYVIGSLQAIATTGKSYDVESKSNVQYDLTGIPFARASIKYKGYNEGKRLIVKGNKVQLEMTDRNGIKTHFSVSGKRIR